MGENQSTPAMHLCLLCHSSWLQHWAPTVYQSLAFTFSFRVDGARAFRHVLQIWYECSCWLRDQLVPVSRLEAKFQGQGDNEDLILLNISKMSWGTCSKFSMTDYLLGMMNWFDFEVRCQSSPWPCVPIMPWGMFCKCILTWTLVQSSASLWHMCYSYELLWIPNLKSALRHVPPIQYQRSLGLKTSNWLDSFPSHNVCAA